ncbi:MAG: hypothetical protein ACO38W_11480, partial [Phycisphaerales bacterium]
MALHRFANLRDHRREFLRSPSLELHLDSINGGLQFNHGHLLNLHGNSCYATLSPRPERILAP